MSMVCGDYDKCQCYKGWSQDYVCWKDDKGNILTKTKWEYKSTDMERMENETYAECLSRHRKMKIDKLLNS